MNLILRVRQVLSWVLSQTRSLPTWCPWRNFLKGMLQKFSVNMPDVILPTLRALEILNAICSTVKIETTPLKFNHHKLLDDLQRCLSYMYMYKSNEFVRISMQFPLGHAWSCLVSFVGCRGISKPYKIEKCSWDWFDSGAVRERQLLLLLLPLLGCHCFALVFSGVVPHWDLIDNLDPSKLVFWSHFSD